MKEEHTKDNIAYTEFTNLNAKYNDIVTERDILIKDKEYLNLTYKELQDTYNNLVAEHTQYNNVLNNQIETLKSKLLEKDEALNKALNEIQSLTNRLNTESGKIEEVKSKTEVAVTSIKKKLQALNDGLGDEFNIFG